MNKELWLIKPSVLNLWNALLAHLRPQYPDCFIAGGAVRDAIARRDPNDIDVFTWLPLDEAHHEPPPPPGLEIHNSDDVALDGGTKASSRLLEVSRYLMFESKHKYQIVQVNPQTYEPGNAERVVSEFGLGIQQAWYDGKEAHVTPAFTYNFTHKVITVEYCESDLEMTRLLRKVSRMQSRDPQQGNLIILPSFHQYLNIQRLS